MSEHQAESVIAATYASEALARADYEKLVELKRHDQLDHTHAVVVVRELSGKVRAKQHSFETTEVAGMGAVLGIIAGAVLGVAFPPLGLAVASAALAGGVGGGLVGGAVGAAVGHLEGELSHADIDELADVLKAGEAAIVVVCEPVHAELVCECLIESQSQHVVEVSGVSVVEAIAAVTEILNGSESDES